MPCTVDRTRKYACMGKHVETFFIANFLRCSQSIWPEQSKESNIKIKKNTSISK